MATSKKDFEAIAKILKRNSHAFSSSDSGMHAVACVAEALADYFRTGNPAFDRERFLQACAPDTPAERERKRVEMSVYANLNS
jgi:hypothetical protein